MSVDCRAVSGFGIELTGEIVEKMISAGILTKDAQEQCFEEYFEDTVFGYGEAGSRYSGNIRRYIFVVGDTIQKLATNERAFVHALEKIGVSIKRDDIKEICDVLWY